MALSEEEIFGRFSEDKSELFRLLLEKKFRQTQQIRPYDRPQTADSIDLPISWAQQRLWFVDQLEGGSAAYNIPVVIRLRGVLNQDALQKALNTSVQRHEVLRTVFVSRNGIPTQQVSPQGYFALAVVNLRACAPAERDQQVRSRAISEARAKFDLINGPLIRGQLLRLEAEEHVLLVTMHHIVSDGWSMSVFVREFSELYGAFCEGHSDPLKALSIQYADYAQWQREWLQGNAITGQLEYWRQHLEGVAPALELPTDRLRPAVQSYRGEDIAIRLDANLTGKLKELAQRYELTLFMVLYAAWAMLLHRLSGEEDIAIGTPVANRQRPELEKLIGFFANTLVLRTTVRDDVRVADFFRQIREVTLGAYDHQDVPFEQLVEMLQPQRSLSRNPIFQVVFALQNAPKGDLRLPGLTATVEEGADHPSVFDLFLSLEERGTEIVGSLNYAMDLFDRSTIERWIACFTVLLREMADSPQMRIGDLSLLPSAERRKVLESFNATQTSYPNDKSIQELFEQQVERTPDAVAVVYEAQALTYAELNAQANQLAHYLIQHGSGVGEYIPIVMPRCLRMVVAQLAVLKAGGVYVPVDPKLPEERLRFLLQDCSARRVLTAESSCAILQQDVPEWIKYDELNSDLSALSHENPALKLAEIPSAYVMYTSGSTGVPKGVIVPHRAVNRLVFNNGYARIEFSDCLAYGSNPAFDASTFEVWGALLNGARVLIVPQSIVLEAQRFAALLIEHKVTVLWITVGLFTQYADALSEVFSRLRYLLVGGDTVEPSVVRKVMQNDGPLHLLNCYGPTECTTFTTTYPVENVDENTTLLPIGKPIANAQIYIVNSCMQPAPIGIAGEMYIGGDGVALGYLNRSDLSAERFVRNMFNPDPRSLLYKSGDLARWRADGNIEFIGRNDQQVKLRGFRIELGEIEAQLVRHAQVREAGVIARQDGAGEKRLVAYVVPEGPDPAVEELRGHLKATLPEYMVPSAFVMLERLPLTVNGKLDRASLPAPDMASFELREYEAPLGEVEEILAGIWQTLLGVERVGRQDNFFELGGHSLLIVQVLERLRRIGLAAEVRRVYESATLADLALSLTRGRGGEFEVPRNLIPAGCDSITPQMLPLVELDAEQIELIAQSVHGGAANIQDIYPLAPLQEGILFHHQLSKEEGDVYVLATLLALPSREKLDALISSLQEVMNRHDVLRTAVLWDQLPRPVQVVYRHATLPVSQLVLNPDQDAISQLRERLRPEFHKLDLQRAPLLQLQVAQDPKNEQWYALLRLHHLICDHESLDVLLEEMIAYVAGHTQSLPDALPYRNHVAQALEHARTHDAESFFRKKLADIDEPSAPFGLLDVRGTGGQIDEANKDLEPALAQRIRVLARRLGVSAATLFHAAWGLVVAHTSGKDDVVFGSILLGRLQGTAGAQRILGMFINTLPLRLRLQNVSAAELVEQTQRELVELLSNEQASLAEARRCSGISGSAPLFTALLNYRHSVRKAETDWSRVSGIRDLGGQDWTNYPITFSIDDSGEGFQLTAQTERAIDPQRIIAFMSTAMDSLVDALEHAPQTPARALLVLPESERSQIVERFNATQASYPKQARIPDLFEDQVERTPDAIAVLYDGQSVTYDDLNKRANQLARYLRAKGVGPDQLVGICLERSVDMVVGLLGILKAGGAYLPLDPNYPRERLQHMLADAAPKVVLTQEKLAGVLPSTKAELIVLDRTREEMASCELDNLLAENFAPENRSPENLVYVIYTSGSTGVPKGTAMSHRSMVNLVEWHRNSFPDSEGTRVLQFAALSFDVAFQETFSTLCTGGTLVLLDEWLRRDARALMELLSNQHIERLFVPPVMLQSIAESFKASGTVPQNLRDVITAGEQLRISPEIAGLFKNLNGCRLHNHYGPTESHVVTSLTLEGDPDTWPTLPAIGKPIANTQMYVLDAGHRPVPIGVAGEIYIGGANVARGYLGREDLTAQRFVKDPFSADLAARLYKTGDLGRWRSDGVLEYLGRNDDQVKIRGFRIELGEIESQLAMHEQVKESVVIAREDVPGEKRLVAYVTRRDERELNAEELRTHLSTLVPEYMVPSAFVVLDALPLSPNGKVDRRVLPAPELGAFASREYEPPQGEIEEALAEIWQSLLRVERVGRKDNFFELGGHSLLATRVNTRITRVLEVELPLRLMFEKPTIEALGKCVVQAIAAEISMEAS